MITYAKTKESKIFKTGFTLLKNPIFLNWTTKDCDLNYLNTQPM